MSHGSLAKDLALNLYKDGMRLPHIPAMTIVVAGSFARRHRPATGKQKGRNDDK
jgi:hypothetical protein